MPGLRTFLCTFLSLGALIAPSTALAQVPPPAGPPPDTAAPPRIALPAPIGVAPSPFAPLPSSAVPLGPAVVVAPAEEPPPEPPRPKHWYGWQIIVPTALGDALFLGGLLGAGASDSSGGSNAGFGVALAGLAVHALSGPIVHLAHGQKLRALGSFGLEAVLPGVVLASAFASTNNCGEGCPGLGVLMTVFPIAMTAGPAIDAAALAYEDRSPTRDASLAPRVSVAPLILPPLRVGSRTLPSPAGVSLVGTF